jgi:transcriptional regulator with XRE-family HTH domain
MFPNGESKPDLNAVARQTIKKWMRATGMTQKELADHLGVTQAWVSRYLRGRMEADLNRLRDIAEIFDNTIATMLLVPPDPGEREIVTMYRAADPAVRQAVRVLLQRSTQTTPPADQSGPRKPR